MLSNFFNTHASSVSATSKRELDVKFADRQNLITHGLCNQLYGTMTKFSLVQRQPMCVYRFTKTKRDDSTSRVALTTRLGLQLKNRRSQSQAANIIEFIYNTNSKGVAHNK